MGTLAMIGEGISRLAEVDLPVFGSPESIPVIPPQVYADRVQSLRDRAAEVGFDHVVIYSDREHSANISYLTGFDPRFEEAMLIVGEEPIPSIYVGNECMGMADAAPLPLRVSMFQDFSLPSQPRNRSNPLAKILADEGIRQGKRVGVVGWKTFDDPQHLDIPSYLADAIREIAGPEHTWNAADLLIDAQSGMRVINDVDQIAYFEYASCHTSTGVRNLLFGLSPGMTEQEAVSLLGWNGSPLSCHLMLTAGERARIGLLSPGDRVIEVGDPMTVAYGIWGALNCRAGFVVGDQSGLPSGADGYIDRLVRPYFEAVAEWYRAIHIGQTGGVLNEIIKRRLGDPFFGIFLNPGHQIHLDEWVNSPVFAGSAIELRSGMAMQVDIIPATGTDYFTTNIEDGIVLADAAMQSRLSMLYPDAWSRILARRLFMAESLGIELHPDVLPLSNMPAYLPPFFLSPGQAMTFA
jgi:hypothetical protein